MISRFFFSSKVIKWYYKNTYIILQFSEQRLSDVQLTQCGYVAPLLSVFLSLNLLIGLTSSLASPSCLHSVQSLLHFTVVSLQRLPETASSTVPWIVVLLCPSLLCFPFSWFLPCLLVESMPFVWLLNIGDLPTLWISARALRDDPSEHPIISSVYQSCSEFFLSLRLEYPTLCRTSLTSIANATWPKLNAPSPLQKLLFQ